MSESFIPEKLRDLPRRLQEAGVTRVNYEIEGVTPPTPGNDNIYELARSSDRWVLFYWERDRRRAILTFDNGEEAADALFNRLLQHAQAARRPRPAPDSAEELERQRQVRMQVKADIEARKRERLE